jgi:hypothetical protein
LDQAPLGLTGVVPFEVVKKAVTSKISTVVLASAVPERTTLPVVLKELFGGRVITLVDIAPGSKEYSPFVASRSRCYTISANQ